MAYEVLVHHKAKKKFDNLWDPELKERFRDVFGLLSEPFGLDIVKLKGQDDSFRIRVGRYRILIKIEKKIVYVIDFDVRGKVYK